MKGNKKTTSLIGPWFRTDRSAVVGEGVLPVCPARHPDLVPGEPERDGHKCRDAGCDEYECHGVSLPFLEEVHEELACRGGVDAHQGHDHDVHCGGFHRGESQYPVGEPDADAGHEQCAENDP